MTTCSGNCDKCCSLVLSYKALVRRARQEGKLSNNLCEDISTIRRKMGEMGFEERDFRIITQLAA